MSRCVTFSWYREAPLKTKIRHWLSFARYGLPAIYFTAALATTIPGLVNVASFDPALGSDGMTGAS